MSALASSGGIKEQLGTLFKQVREAQTLDLHGDEMGAYRHYLSSVSLASQVLSADIQANQGQGTLPEQQVDQLYKIAKDCLERGQDIICLARKEKRPLALFRMATPSPTVSPTLLNHPLGGSSQMSHHPHTLHPGPASSAQNPPPSSNSSSSHRPPQFSRNAPQNLGIRTLPNHHPHQEAMSSRNMSWPGGPRGARSLPRGLEGTDGIPGGHVRGAGQQLHQSQPSNGCGSGPVHTMPFMAEAKMRNRHMMEQYKSHLRQQCSAGKPAYNEAGLSMLRRLEENLSVARIREQNLQIAKRLKEKQLRAREAGVKAKPQVALNTLSLEELCDQVTSFEHGKSKIINIKARLNGSDSDPSVVYAAISELLSISDHPLSRLLGEYQYGAYMMLQPVGAAVEKAGGLPRLDIQLDKGLDRKPSEGAAAAEDGRPHPSEGGGGQRGGTRQGQGRGGVSPRGLTRNGSSDDDLLDLLCDEEEGEEPAGNLSDSQDQPNEETPIGSNTFDSKLERLKQELLGNGNKDRNESGSKLDADATEGSFGSKNRNVDENGEDELSSAPMFDEIDGDAEAFSIQDNECYQETTPTHLSDRGVRAKGNIYSDVPGTDQEDTSVYETPIDAMGGRGVVDGRGQDAIYEDMDSIDKMMSKEGGAEGAEPGSASDSVFVKDNDERHIYCDIPDGGMLSRQAPPPLPIEQIELEEVAMFKNLPPLVCTAHLGDEATMKKLADTAAGVISEVVKHIHISLEKLLSCFSQCYPIISCEENQELCRTVLEASFFPALLSPLTIVYRCKHYSEEVAVAKNMCQQVNASPRDLNVRKKYWLLEQSHAPYGEAIDELRRITSYQYPSPKLECLVKMSKQVVKCIESYHNKYHPKAKLDLVGVDDMLPILSYVILRSGLPQLVSECSIMEEFIQEGYMMGEEGFCLTSFLTALKYVTQMSS